MNDNSFIKKVLIVISLSAFVILLLLLFGYIINIVLLVFAGILLAIFLRGLSHLTQKFIHVSEHLALFIVVVCLILIIAGLCMIMGPNLVQGVENLADKIPSSIDKLQNSIKEYSWGKALIKNINDTAKTISNNSQIKSHAIGVFSSSLTGLLNIIVILVVGLYSAYDPKLYTESFLKLITKRKRKRVSEIITLLQNALAWWMVGRFSAMIIVGILTTIGLWVLGMPLVFTLGVIAGLLTFIPYLGAVVSAIPAVLLALVESPTEAVYVIILYTLIHTIEGYFITPVIQKRAVSLPPALLIVVQVMIEFLLGIFGLLLATPIMVAVIVLIQTLYVQDILGNDVEVLAENNKNVLSDS